ncbi:GNAT family N-acetyltransferase [Microbacterium flavum]|uniref:GNAT family N-acetyltransferase n=2 Tax=Microbacterium flavum TaxID=415216 RepID=A0ABS5XW44_9MICO|nr:GNAT family N-acetyltransferase [Microbacterium flavum]
MTLTLRPAASDDAAIITDIHRLSREAYYGAALDASDAARDRFPMWRRLLADPAMTFTIAWLEAEPLGFIAAREDSAPTTFVELVGLYVHPSHFGRGIGNRLHHWFDDQYSSYLAHLEVWSGNERAQAFYRRRRWNPSPKTRAGPAGTSFVTWRRLPVLPTRGEDVRRLEDPSHDDR